MGKDVGPEHPSVATALVNLATLKLRESQYSVAESLFQRALAIRKTLFGSEHPDVAFVLANLAMLEYHRHNYSDAESLYKQALNIWDQAPDLRPGIRTDLSCCALYFDVRRWDEAGAFRAAVTLGSNQKVRAPRRGTYLSKVAMAGLGPRTVRRLSAVQASTGT
jgi:tetratricopeptide (TPR) repeat protein